MQNTSETTNSRSSFLVNLAILLVSFAVALVIAELVLRSSLISVRNVGASFTVYDEYYGKRLKSNFSTVRSTPEYSMQLTTNSLGFRGTEPEVFPAGSIVFLGDSFTLGYGVSDGEEYPSLVGDELGALFPNTRVPVVNAGIGDSGNGRWVKFLRTDADQFEPRLVVMQFMNNDFRDNFRERLFVLQEGSNELMEVPQRISSGRRLQSVIEFVPGLADTYLLGKLREIQVASPSAAGAAQQMPVDARVRAAAERFAHRLVEEAIKICKEKGYPVLMLNAGVDGTPRQKLEALYEWYQVPHLWIPTKADRPDLYFEIDGHWNAAGHEYTAGTVIDFLREHGSIIDNSSN